MFYLPGKYVLNVRKIDHLPDFTLNTMNTHFIPILRFT